VASWLERGDYSFKLIAGFVVFAGLIGFLLETTYREFFESIIKLSLSEEYSYIIVSFFTVLTVLYLATRYIGFSYGVRLSKVVFAATLLAFSIAIYMLARVDLERGVQLMGLSFACVFVSLLVFIYEPSTLREVIVLLTPLLLIPLPTSIIDSLTPTLSRYIGLLAGFVTGARVIESPGFTQIEVVSASGESVRLSVEAACTGIVTTSCIIAVTPLLAYIASFSVDKPLRKVIISLLSILTALMIGLVGNFVRVILVIYVAMNLGVEYAYTIFHYSPSILYSAISVLAAVYIMRRYLNFKEIPLRSLREDFTPRATWDYIAGVLLLLIIVVGATSLIVQSASTGLGVSSVIVEAHSVSEYLSNPAKYLSTSKLVFTGGVYDAFLTRVLGGLSVYRVSASSMGELYTGYIELVDTPARLHTWELCLTLQGYSVKSSWSTDVEGARVNFIVIERGVWRGVLAYTLIPITIRTPSGDYNVYTRVSLVSGEVVNATDKLTSALISIIVEHSSVQSRGGGVLNTLMQAFIYMLGVFLAYLVVLAIYKLYGYRVKGAFHG
jgi:hypothetical protein